MNKKKTLNNTLKKNETDRITNNMYTNKSITSSNYTSFTLSPEEK